MTRLAASSWGVWRDICLTNQSNISNVLGALIAELQSLKDALDARDFNRARELFTAAKASVPSALFTSKNTNGPSPSGKRRLPE